MNAEKILQAARLLADARHVACLTGAGVSAESGIATFRDAQTGHWSRFDPQALASQAGFAADPGLVWRWYMDRLESARERAEPNAGHVALAEIAARVPRFTLITQNVDDLHERAGSTNVHHLHGSIGRFRCNECEREHVLRAEERRAEMPPQCAVCGGLVRPDVVWFGEMLPRGPIEAAWEAATECDVMLVVGTSGIVYPAAQLPYLASENGATVIDVNPEIGALADITDLFLQGPSGEVLPRLVQALSALHKE